VEFAKKFNVPFEVRSSFNNNPGTLVKEEVESMEGVVVRGVALDKSQAKIVVRDVPDRPGAAAAIFDGLAGAGISVDMIVQNIGREGVANLTFTVARDDVYRAEEVMNEVFAKLGGGPSIESHDNIAKLSIVGIGMRSHSGVAAKLFTALAEAGINLQVISTSEIKISVAIDPAGADEAMRVAHAAFELHEAQAERL
jgi:aspartate kinase